MPAYPPSASSFFYFTHVVASAGTAEQLTAYQVPEGMEIVITARRSNTQNRYLADSQTNAQTAANRKILVPGQSTTLQIDTTSKIWTDGDNGTDRIEITVQRIPSTGG